MTAGKRGLLPPAWLLVALVSQAVAHRLLPVAVVASGAWEVLGAGLILLGVSGMVAADRQFKVVRTAINPFAKASTLVTSGLFRLSRNPMYLGLILVLVGVACALGTLTPFLVPPLVARLLVVRFIRHEEAALLEAFGMEYKEYQRRVRRWL